MEVGGEFVLQYQAGLFKAFVGVARVNWQADQGPAIRE